MIAAESAYAPTILAALSAEQRRALRLLRGVRRQPLEAL